MKRKLYKSSGDKVFFGVLGGFAEKHNLNSSAVRIVFSLLTCFTAVIPGLFLYVILGIALKTDPMINVNYKEYLENKKEKTLK